MSANENGAPASHNPSYPVVHAPDHWRVTFQGREWFFQTKPLLDGSAA